MPAFLASARRLGWAAAGLALTAPTRAAEAATSVVIRFMLDSSSLGKQHLEGPRESGRLIGPHARSGKRGHAPDGCQPLRLGLEHHQTEGLLVVAARAPYHQQRRGDTVELAARDVGARVILHALDGALDLGWLHREGHGETAGSVAFDAILPKDLANRQRTQRRDVTPGCQVGVQARHASLNDSRRVNQRDGKVRVGQDRHQGDDAEAGQDSPRAPRNAPAGATARRGLAGAGVSSSWIGRIRTSTPNTNIAPAVIPRVIPTSPSDGTYVSQCRTRRPITVTFSR